MYTTNFSHNHGKRFSGIIPGTGKVGKDRLKELTLCDEQWHTTDDSASFCACCIYEHTDNPHARIPVIFFESI